MLEIFVIYKLCQKVGEIISEKGRKPIGYQILAAALWIGGEIFGAIFGTVICMAVLDQEEPGLLVYLFAIIGAICGAGIAYAIAKMVSPLDDEYQSDGYDDIVNSCKSCGEEVEYQTDKCPVCGAKMKFRPSF